MPTSLSGTSFCPWNRRSALYVVWPCRHVTSVMTSLSSPPGQMLGATASSAAVKLAPTDRLRQRDQGAVLPQPLQRVVDPLLGVLDVDHDVDVVEQYPARFPLSFAAGGPGPGLP